ncbi:hypothetical protein [Streptomyces sp. NPDC014894]|uniref:hypothetical protein n=1 Tax=Streptomyces sp. NPDC014894 TaxID=3364931 RepID=UPI0036F5E41F
MSGRDFAAMDRPTGTDSHAEDIPVADLFACRPAPSDRDRAAARPHGERLPRPPAPGGEDLDAMLTRILGRLAEDADGYGAEDGDAYGGEGAGLRGGEETPRWRAALSDPSPADRRARPWTPRGNFRRPPGGSR